MTRKDFETLEDAYSHQERLKLDLKDIERICKQMEDDAAEDEYRADPYMYKVRRAMRHREIEAILMLLSRSTMSDKSLQLNLLNGLRQLDCGQNQGWMLSDLRTKYHKRF
jgi:hypothetical protein